MTDEERKAINNFQYFDKNTIITDELVNDKNIVMDLLAKLQKENEELKDEINQTSEKPKYVWPAWWNEPKYNEWPIFDIIDEKQKHPIWSTTHITL